MSSKVRLSVATAKQSKRSYAAEKDRRVCRIRCGRSKCGSKVPEYLSDEEAASVPLTALTALKAFELMNIKSGKTVFISGGTGSLGAMAIPVAKSMGLNVITNGSAQNQERVMRLGADRFINYKSEDYSKALSDVDYVLDTMIYLK